MRVSRDRLGLGAVSLRQLKRPCDRPADGEGGPVPAARGPQPVRAPRLLLLKVRHHHPRRLAQEDLRSRLLE